MCILQYNGHRPAKAVTPDTVDGMIVDGDLSGLNVKEARQQVQYGCLSCSGSAHQSYLLSGSRMQGYSFQDGFFRTVAEIYILQGYISFCFFECDGIRRILLLRCFVYDLEDAFGSGNGCLYAVVEARQFIDGASELPGILQESRQSAHVEPAEDGQ